MTTKKEKTKRSMPLGPLLNELVGPLTFGTFMRVARDRMELSQVEMARRLGFTRATLCGIEKGRQLVSVTVASQIAKKAGLSPEVAVQACLQDQLRKAKLRWQVKLIA